MEQDGELHIMVPRQEHPVTLVKIEYISYFEFDDLRFYNNNRNTIHVKGYA